MQITYQQRMGEDGEPVTVPVIPPDTTADEIEAILAAEAAAVLTDEQFARFEKYFSEGVTRDGFAR